MVLERLVSQHKAAFTAKTGLHHWIKSEKADYMTIIYANVSAGRNRNMIDVCSWLAWTRQPSGGVSNLYPSP